MIYDDIRFCCHRSSFDLVTIQLLKCFGSCYSVRIKRGDINGEGGGDWRRDRQTDSHFSRPEIRLSESNHRQTTAGGRTTGPRNTVPWKTVPRNTVSRETVLWKTVLRKTVSRKTVSRKTY